MPIKENGSAASCSITAIPALRGCSLPNPLGGYAAESLF